jgi:DNA-binding transcriptional MerR regulator
MVNGEILTAKQVMELLNICENTLLRLERDGAITVDFRLGNRKRYYKDKLLRRFGK